MIVIQNKKKAYSDETINFVFNTIAHMIIPMKMIKAIDVWREFYLGRFSGMNYSVFSNVFNMIMSDLVTRGMAHKICGGRWFIKSVDIVPLPVDKEDYVQVKSRRQSQVMRSDIRSRDMALYSFLDPPKPPDPA